MDDDELWASLRPPGGWSRPAEPTSSPAPAPEPVAEQPSAVAHAPLVDDRAADPGAAREDDERWLLACIGRGHVRWDGSGLQRIATRYCTHTSETALVSGPVADLVDAGLAQRAGQPGGKVQLTTDGRRRLADLERGSGA